MSNLKVAFSGSSGSGKTTLVEYVYKEMGLEWISGSAGSVKKEGDKMIVDDVLKYPGGGHHGVIAYSALNSTYAILNQKLLQLRRAQIISENNNFVTDRSPADNLTYFVSQVGYHPEVTESLAEEFAKDCLRAWEGLTHVIFVKAVQPSIIEVNGSRIANKFYQKAVDCQFEYWITNYFMKNAVEGPEVFIIDFWDLETRKKKVIEFLQGKLELVNNRFKIGL